MRKLAWAALGFAVAAGLAEYVLPWEELPFYAVALAILGLAASRVRPGPRRVQALACCLAASVGFLGWWGNYRVHVAPSEALVGQTVTLSARTTDYVERHEDYERVPVRIEDGAPGVKALLYSYDEPLPALEPGDVISAEVRVASAVTRQGERSRIYTSQGIYLLGYVREGTLSLTGRAPCAGLRTFPQRLCRAVLELCRAFFDEDVSPFVQGLLTGDTTALEADTENHTAMRVAGVMHIVAVSGMHLFVLMGFLQLLLGKSRRTSIVCIAVIWLFALMAGGRPSVVRAAVMQTLYLAAPLVRRESDGVTCLGAALLLLLARNPMAIGSVGLQLSFACMLGFIFLLPALHAWMGRRLPVRNRAVRWAANDLACSVSANAFSLPLTALYFGQLPLWSLAANLLTLWAVEIVFAGALGTCALGAAWPAAGRALGGALSWLARLCMWVYRAIASLPAASLSMRSVRAEVWLAGLYALLILWYVQRRRGRSVPWDVPACAAVIGLCLALIGGKLSVGEGEGLVTVLDVGQGECVVLASHETTAVVDCGGSGLDNAGDVAADYLQSIGRTRLDLLVLTHLHADHADGVQTLLYRMPVGRLVLPAAADDADALLADILAAARKRGVPVTFLREPARFRTGDLTLELLLPQGGDVNERGVVALGTVAGSSALIMGDAGMEAELSLLREGSLPAADVLVAGHHGSAGASGQMLLLAVRPQTAVVSVGYNSYGQPSEAAMERLETYCPSVRRTDLEGDVTVRFSEDRDGEEDIQTG